MGRHGHWNTQFPNSQELIFQTVHSNGHSEGSLAHQGAIQRTPSQSKLSLLTNMPHQLLPFPTQQTDIERYLPRATQ